MSELRECPFCWSNEIYIQEVSTASELMFWVVCHNCAKGDTLPHFTKQEAIEAWNTRYEPTCHIDYSFSNGFDELETVMECGNTIIGELPDYCPGCGQKVVDE